MPLTYEISIVTRGVFGPLIVIEHLITARPSLQNIGLRRYVTR